MGSWTEVTTPLRPIRMILILVVILIVYGSLYPGTFRTEGVAFSQAVSILIHSWPTNIVPSLSVDIVLNVLIYIPVGIFGVIACSNRSRLTQTLAPVSLGLLLSAAMELLQACIPGRVTSLLDLLSNLSGAVSGVILAGFFSDWIRKHWPVIAAGLSNQPGAALLLTLWISAQWLPLIPGIGLYRLHAKWTQAANVDWHRFPLDILAAGSAWLAAMVLLEAVASAAASWSFLLPALIIPCSFLIANQHPTAGQLTGAALAAFVSRIVLHKSSHRKSTAATILVLAILIGGLAPFDFRAAGTSFSWVPFGVSLQMSSWEAAIVVLSAKAFRYGAAVWLLQQLGMGFLQSGALIAVLLGVIEFMQVYLPTRSAEITDPVMCLLLAMILKWLHAASTLVPQESFPVSRNTRSK